MAWWQVIWCTVSVRFVPSIHRLKVCWSSGLWSRKKKSVIALPWHPPLCTCESPSIFLSLCFSLCPAFIIGLQELWVRACGCLLHRHYAAMGIRWHCTRLMITYQVVFADFDIVQDIQGELHLLMFVWRHNNQVLNHTRNMVSQRTRKTNHLLILNLQEGKQKFWS